MNSVKFQTGDYEAVHSSPIWRNKADFIFAALIGRKNGINEWEQLWGKKVGINRIVLCCIPFFARGINLGDVVETDANDIFQRVDVRSDQVTFRVWFNELTGQEKEEVVREIERLNPLVEWSSKNLLAVSVASSDSAKLEELLSSLEHSGRLQFENG